MKKILLFAVIFLLAHTEIDLVSAHDGVNLEIAAIGIKIQKDPENATLLIERAALYRRLRDYSASLDDLTRARKLAPQRRAIDLEQGLTLEAAGRNDAAERSLSTYLASGLVSARAFAARGRIRETGKRYAEARVDYAAAAKLEPNPDLFLATGRMDETLGHWDDAARVYEEGMRLLSGAVVLRLALVRVEHRRGHYDRAIAIIDEIMPHLPVKIDWLILRAEQHAAAGNLEKARSDRDSALREAEERMARRPTEHARMGRAKALHALGRHAEALREIDMVLQKAPKFGDARALRQEIRSSLQLPR